MYKYLEAIHKYIFASLKCTRSDRQMYLRLGTSALDQHG